MAKKQSRTPGELPGVDAPASIDEMSDEELEALTAPVTGVTVDPTPIVLDGGPIAPELFKAIDHQGKPGAVEAADAKLAAERAMRECPKCLAFNDERPCSVECYVAAGYKADTYSWSDESTAGDAPESAAVAEARERAAVLASKPRPYGYPGMSDVKETPPIVRLRGVEGQPRVPVAAPAPKPAARVTGNALVMCKVTGDSLYSGGRVHHENSIAEFSPALVAAHPTILVPVSE